MIAIGAVVVLAVGFTVLLSFVQEEARELNENGDYCKSFKILKWTSLVSGEGKYLLGSLYARGLCVDQDISSAKKLYGAIYDEPTKIGRTLFYDAIEIADVKERNKEPLKMSAIRALFDEAKRLGFTPSEADASALTESNLQSVFTGSN